MPTFTFLKTKFLIKPCIALLRLLKLTFRKPISIASLKYHRRRTKKRTAKRRRHPKSTPAFPCIRRSMKSGSEQMDGVADLKSFTERIAAPFSSPLTPAFIKLLGARYNEEEEEADTVEEACRSFENYLVEMMVEEGNLRDLTDVEELLCCWNSLKSPVFVNLVSRFYGELCKDLFSSSGASTNCYDWCSAIDDHDDDSFMYE